MLVDPRRGWSAGHVVTEEARSRHSQGELCRSRRPSQHLWAPSTRLGSVPHLFRGDLWAVMGNTSECWPAEGRAQFCYLPLGRDWFVMKSNKILAHKLTFLKKVYSRILPLATEFCELSLFLLLRLWGTFLYCKDEGWPDNAPPLHLPVKSLISYTWVASNPSFTLRTNSPKSRLARCHICRVIKGHAAPETGK